MRKEAAEMKVFTEFAMAANLHVDSGTAENEKPP
jgi:hypothetical protein